MLVLSTEIASESSGYPNHSYLRQHDTVIASPPLCQPPRPGMSANCSATQEGVCFDVLAAGCQRNLHPVSVAFCLASTLKMVAMCSSEMSDFLRTTQLYKARRPHSSNHRMLWNFRIFLPCLIPKQCVVTEYDFSLGNLSRLKVSDRDLKSGPSDAFTSSLHHQVWKLMA
jgi:hypothetical protein